MLPDGVRPKCHLGPGIVERDRVSPSTPSTSPTNLIHLRNYLIRLTQYRFPSGAHVTELGIFVIYWCIVLSI